MGAVAALTPPYAEIFGTGILLEGDATGAWKAKAELLNHIYSETKQVAFVWPNGVETSADRTYNLPSTASAWRTWFSMPVHVVDDQDEWEWGVYGVTSGAADGELRLYDVAAATVLDTIALPLVTGLVTQSFAWGAQGDRTLQVQFRRTATGAASFTSVGIYYDTVPL